MPRVYEQKIFVVDGCKPCSVCKQSLHVDHFSRDRQTFTGYKSTCRQCVKQRVSHKTLYQTIDYRARYIFNGARHRANKKNLPFDLQVVNIEILLRYGRCAKSGFVFDLNVVQDMQRNPFGPSLDRIDNRFGYTPDNIQMVCNLYNIGKGESPELDFIALCLAVAARNQDNVDAIARLKVMQNAAQL